MSSKISNKSSNSTWKNKCIYKLCLNKYKQYVTRFELPFLWELVTLLGFKIWMEM